MCPICEATSHSPNVIWGLEVRGTLSCENNGIDTKCGIYIYTELHFLTPCFMFLTCPLWELQPKQLPHETSGLGRNKQLWILETVYSTQRLVPRDVTSPEFLPEPLRDELLPVVRREGGRIQTEDFKLNTAGDSQHCIDFVSQAGVTEYKVF